MTTLGKILVFVNLVFSLVVCALIIMVYIARTNWHDAYRQQEDLYKASRASTDAAYAELKAVSEEKEAKVAAADAVLKKAQAELDTQRKELAAAQDNLKNMTLNRNKSDAAVTKLQSELQRRADEVKKMEEFVTTLNERNGALVKEMLDLRDKKTAAEIQNNTLRVRNEGMQRRLEELEKEKALARATGGAASGQKGGINPPLQDAAGGVKGPDWTGRRS